VAGEFLILETDLKFVENKQIIDEKADYIILLHGSFLPFSRKSDVAGKCADKNRS
jgi:hypothetical protein